jgi:CelD/BcsL family acetyltransferase involved in cellulose biosynthesis
VAYIIGYRIGDCFYLEITGYDSDWKKWSVGAVCILLSLQSMLLEKPPLRRYDFLSWDFEYKKRFGNKYWLEANFYAFPTERRVSAIYFFLKSNIIVSNILRRIVRRRNANAASPTGAGDAVAALRDRRRMLLRG